MKTKVYLLIPLGTSQDPIRVPLRLDPQSGSYGLGRIKYGDSILDGATFRRFRATLGASLETNDPDAVRAALGVPMTEPLEPPPAAAGSISAKLVELIGPDRGAAVQLAGKIGIGHDTLREYTTRPNPSVPGAAMLLRIARGLGVSLAEFDKCNVGE